MSGHKEIGKAIGSAKTTAEAFELKIGLAEMMKGGVIMMVGVMMGGALKAGYLESRLVP